MKRIKSLISVFVCAALCVLYVPSAQAESTIDFFEIGTDGICEIYGVNELGIGNDTTILMTTEPVTNDIEADKIMYIDQLPNGNNGVFYFKFPLNPKFSGQEYYLYIGNVGGEPLARSGTLGEIPTLVHTITDGSIRIGNDAYVIGSAYYTPSNIVKSLSSGSNYIYYKIGGEWFDLRDSRATTTAFFKAENAVPREIWYDWDINRYYINSLF